MSAAAAPASPALEDFVPYVGSRFRAESVALELEAAEPTRGESEARQPFSLLFRGPAVPRLAQATRTLEHEALGSIVLFLVPIAGDAESTRYEAIFS